MPEQSQTQKATDHVIDDSIGLEQAISGAGEIEATAKEAESDPVTAARSLIEARLSDIEDRLTQAENAIVQLQLKKE